MSGLFGDQDAADIPDDPFYIAEGTYDCILVEAEPASSRDGRKHGLTFKWKIDDEESEFNGLSISDWNTYYPNGTDGEDETAVRRNLANLKKRLLSIGVTEDQMNASDLDWLEEFLGMRAYVTIKRTKDKNDPDKVYTNITKIELED